MTFAPASGNIVGSGWFEIKPGLSQDTADFAKGFTPLGQSAASAFAQSFQAGVGQSVGSALAAALNLPAVELQVTADLDEAELSAEVTQAANAVDASIPVETSVDPAELAAEVTAAADAVDPNVDVSTSVDAGELAAEVTSAADSVNPNIDVSVTIDSGEIAAEATAAADAIDPTITYRADIDASAIQSAAASAAAAISTAVGDAGTTGGSQAGEAVRAGLTKGGEEGATNITASVQRALGSISGDIGGVLGVGGGIGAALGLKAAIGDLEIVDRKIRETATLFGQPANQSGGLIDSLQTGVEGVSEKLGLLQTDIVPALYDSISAGVPQSGINEFLVDIGKFATAGAADITVAGDAVTTALNAWQLGASETTKVTDSLFAAVQGGKTTVDQLGGALFNVAPAAASLNVPLQEVNAALATMTSQGIPTSVATTRLNAAFTALLSKSKELTPVFNALGYETAEAAINSEGLQFAVNAVNDAAEGSATGLLKLLGSTEAVQSVQVLAGTGAQKFSDELDRQAGAAGTVAEAFKIMDEGPAAAIRRFQADLQSLGLTLAEAFSPILSAGLPALQAFVPVIEAGAPIIEVFAKAIEVAANAFGALPGPVQTAVIAGVAWNRASDGITSKLSLLGAGIKSFGGVTGLLSSGLTTAAGSATKAGSSIAGVASTFGALGPAGIAAGAAIGIVGAAYLSAKKKSDNFKKATSEITKALEDQEGVLNTSTAALADYLSTQSRFVDRNQVDDLGRMKTSWTEVAQQIEAGDEGLQKFIRTAIDAGEIDVAEGYNVDDAVTQFLRGHDQVLRGNTDLIDSFKEVQESREKAFEGNIDALLVDSRITKNGENLARNYKEMGLSAEQALDKLEQMNAIVPKIVGSLEGTTLNFDDLSEQAQDFAAEMIKAGASSGEVLQGLSDKSLLTASDLQTLQPQLEDAGTGIVELGLASSTAENDMAAMADRSAAAAEANRVLAAATGDAVGQLENLNTIDLGEIQLILPNDASAEAIEDVADILSEMHDFAAENNIPVEIVARFGQDTIEGIKDQFDSMEEGIKGLFDFDIDPDFTSLQDALDSAEAQILASSRFSENLRQLYEDGYADVAQFVSTLGDDQAALFVDQFMGSSDEAKARMQEQASGIKDQFIIENQEWGKLGADAAGVFAESLAAPGEALNSFLQSELQKTPDMVASELAALGVTIQDVPQTVANSITAGGPIVSLAGQQLGLNALDGFGLGFDSLQFGAQIDGVLQQFDGMWAAADTYTAPFQSALQAVEGWTGAFAGGTALSAPIDIGLGLANDSILGGVGTFVPSFSSLATTSVDAFGLPIQTGLPTAAQASLDQTVSTIVGMVPAAYAAANQTGAAVPQGYEAGLPGMDPATRGAFDTVSNIINVSSGILATGAGLAGLNVGQRFGVGIAAGMESQRGAIERKAAAIADAAAVAARAALIIKSPSRVGTAIGGNFGSSIGSGIADSEGVVADAASGLASAAADNADFAGLGDSAAAAANGITDAFGSVTLIPESEKQDTLNFLDIATEKVRGITLEDIQSPSKGNVFTSFADKAFDTIINDSVNEVFTRAANQAVNNLGADAQGNFQAGAGSTVASQGLSPQALAEVGRLIAQGQSTTNLNVSAPATPIIDPFNPRSGTRTADIIGTRISEVLERSNRGEG